MHQDPNFDSQLSSTKKVLHFMCPNLFPVFDRKVCKKLFGLEHQISSICFWLIRFPTRSRRGTIYL